MLVACGFVASGLVAAQETPTTVPTKKPNIVFILADDLGYRELGCFGQQKIKTPHLDRLAEQGMRLTQHYSGSPVCAPSRCVLMTGKDSGHSFVRDNIEVQPEGQQPIADAEVTLAELMLAEGYSTGAFGKWGLGAPGSEGEPLRQGFQRFFGYNCQRHAHSFYPSYLWDDNERIELNNRPPVPPRTPLPVGADPADPQSYEIFKGQDYAPQRYHEQALRFVREHRDGPFFLYYPTILPHVALHVPDEELKPYLALGWNDSPFTAATHGYTPHYTPRAAYAAMISYMDRQMGELFALLDELQLTDNTLIIFTSDNGTTHGAGGVDYAFFDSTGELRGMKGSVYEGGVRVPTVVRWPGKVPPGSSSDFICGFEDWMPTLLEAVEAGGSVPEGTNGISLLPTLLGQSQPERKLLYREFPGYGGQQSIRMGDWKAVRQNMNRGNLAIELYNIRDDISEQHNVADQHPERVAEFESLMKRWRTASDLYPLRPLDP